MKIPRIIYCPEVAGAVGGLLVLAVVLMWRNVLKDADRAGLISILRRIPHPSRHQLRQAFTRWLLRRSYSRNTARLIVMLTPGHDVVTGGMLSIASIYRETIRLRDVHEAEVVMCTLPGDPVLARYTQFADPPRLFTLSDVLAHMPRVSSVLIHIPEYAVSHFLAHCAPEDLARLRRIGDVRFNIMLQNIDLLPSPEAFGLLRQLGRLTCTTAHRAYSTLELAARLACPIHELSVYVSPEQYRRTPYGSKEDLMVVSPDPHPRREAILDLLGREFPSIQVRVIERLTYEAYKALIARAKWSLTFGEGLDGYFVETVFSGGVAFSVYNDRFFTKDFRGLCTIYPSYDALEERMRADLRALDNERDHTEYHRTQYALCAKYYDYQVYRRNLAAYYARHFRSEGR